MISHSSAWTAEPRDFLTMRRRLAATGEASELDVADGAEPDSVLEEHGAEAWPTIEKRGEVLRVEPRRTSRLRRAFPNQRQTGRSASGAQERESLTTSHAKPGRRAAQSRPSWARAGTARRWSPASTLRAHEPPVRTLGEAEAALRQVVDDSRRCSPGSFLSSDLYPSMILAV